MDKFSPCAEIIAVGTEVLMGETLNTNAPYLSERLAEIGIDVFYHTTVGDNPGRMQAIFKTALTRANVILITGGLGPTEDDITVETLAAMFEMPLVHDEKSEAAMREIFKKYNRPMTPNNLKQALRPESAEALFNPVGTAPGLYWDVSKLVEAKGWATGPKLIFAFPGIPREMKALWAEAALPRLQQTFPTHEILVSRSLKFVGIGESALVTKLGSLMSQTQPTVSPYVGQAEIRIRVAAKAVNEEAANRLIEPTVQAILGLSLEYYYGQDSETLESLIGQMLVERKWTLAVAESCTGGLVSSRLTDVPGSSQYVLLNMVTYSNEAKMHELVVSPELLGQHGAVSVEVSKAMAVGIQQHAGTHIGLSITGVAGPDGGTSEKPVGLVYIGVSGLTPEPIVQSFQVNSSYARTTIKTWFSQYTLFTLYRYLTQ